MIVRQNSRIQHHCITSAGVTFTVPPSEDFTDGTWSITDLMLGEFGIQLADDKVFIRTANGIVELQKYDSTLHAEVSTTDATLTSIFEFIPASNCVIQIEARVVGSDAGFTASVGAQLSATFFYDTSAMALTQIGTTNSVINALGTENVIIDTNTTDRVRIRVRGITATSIDWACDLKMTVKYV